MIRANSKDEKSLYLAGMYWGEGSVIKFRKTEGLVRWIAEFGRFDELSKVTAMS